MSLIKKVWRFFKKLILSVCNLPRKFLPVSEDIMLFESVPALSDNTKAVFDEMIARGLNEKYKMVWIVFDKNAQYPVIPNVSYLCATDTTKEEKKNLERIKATAKCIVWCNNIFEKNRKEQVSFYLSHGTPIKAVKDYYVIPRGTDYCLAASEGVKDIISEQFNVRKEKVVPLGFPRNDILTQESKDLRKIFGGEYEKIIVWYPTYRQHKAGGKQATKNALPIIYDVDIAIKLNEYAKENKTLLVIKPHFAQDITAIKDSKLSNLLFITDEFFAQHELTSYEFVASCDALITDYSSIYFDYLLCDKPVAVIWEDYKEYEEGVGFAIDMDKYMKGAEKIYTIDDFKSFIERVSSGQDMLKKERNEVNSIVNYASDGKNAKRVVDFIMEKLSQKS